MRIVFMGTPEFAVSSLEALLNHGCKVVAVVTATDKLGGRGNNKLIKSPVKKFATKNDIPVLQPKNLKGKDFLAELKSYKADLQIVVAFRMLPVVVWDMPAMGTINVHGSLLPAYRGAAPIHWAVIRGEKTTGVTTFFLKHKIDTGDLLLQKSLNIGPDETTGEVYERLKIVGSEALIESVELIKNGKIKGETQNEDLVSHAPKIYHETAEIDWSKSAKTCHDFIRGMNPFPGAWCEHDNAVLKVLRTKILLDKAVLDKTKNLDKGTLYPLLKDETTSKQAPGIAITTGQQGLLEIIEVKPAGKRAMSGSDWRNGMRLNEPRKI